MTALVDVHDLMRDTAFVWHGKLQRISARSRRTAVRNLARRAAGGG